MQLRNGRHLDLRVKDSWGDHAFVFWVANSFDPATFLVRAESFEDAYAWFLCDPKVEAWLKVEDYYEDYIEGWDAMWVEGIGNTNKATLEDLGKAYADGRTNGAVMVNDNGVLVDTDNVQGQELASFIKAPR